MTLDPYSRLETHIIAVKALYCEDCGMVETSSHGDDRSAADEHCRLQSLCRTEGWRRMTTDAQAGPILAARGDDT